MVYPARTELESRTSFGIGTGYIYKDRYGIELRYEHDREILGNDIYLSSEYRTFSVILGYNFY